MRIQGQVGSEDLLPSTEQIQMGGVATVRGYKEGLLIGDDGYFLSVAVGFPLPDAGESGRGFVFVDHGAAFPFKRNGEGIDSSDRLTSIGSCVRFSIGKSVSGILSFGFPLNNRDDSDGEDSSTVHFVLRAALF